MVIRLTNELIKRILSFFEYAFISNPHSISTYRDANNGDYCWEEIVHITEEEYKELLEGIIDLCLVTLDELLE